MRTSVLAAIVIVILALGGLGFVLTRPKTNPSTITTPATNTNTQSDMSNMTSQTPAETTTTPATTNQVVIKNSAFSPTTIKVKVGDTVTWTNQDSIQHDVAPDTESDDFKGSELLSKGGTYSFTFKKAGTYTYHCTPHPFMKATVVVE